MKEHRELLNTLTNCAVECQHCASSCLKEDNAKALAVCISLNKDCADICNLAVKFLSRESKKAISAIGMCADICAECAKECEKHDHSHCIECAKICRQCEQSCRAYLNQ